MKKIRIGDVGEVITGKTPKTSVPEYYGDDFSFVTPADFRGLKSIFHTEKSISTLGMESIGKSFIPAHSICVTCIGSDMGKVSMVEMDCATNQQINSVVPTDNYDCDYIYYAIKYVAPEIKHRGFSSTAVPIVNKTDFSNVLIYCPESKELQTRVARLLMCYDSKIAKNLSCIVVLEKEIQTLYQSWFCDEPVRASWDRVLLNDVIERVTKKNNPLQTEITITISAKDGITSNYYTKRVASKDLSKYTVVEKGDFIYNRSSSDGYPVGVICRLEEFDRVALSPIYFCFRAKNIEFAKFLTYYFNSEDFTTSLYQIVGIGSRGHGMLNFSMNDFMGIELALPPKPLQQKFETVIAPIEQKIAKLKEENTVLAEIRDTLLPKLMSGELPVEVGEN